MPANTTGFCLYKDSLFHLPFAFWSTYFYTYKKYDSEILKKSHACEAGYKIKFQNHNIHYLTESEGGELSSDSTCEVPAMPPDCKLA